MIRITLKKMNLLLWIAVLCFSLISCNAETFNNDVAPAATEYAIGEAFGTNTVECIVTEIKWITPGELNSVLVYASHSINGESVYRIDMDTLFPDCTSSFGPISMLKSEYSGSYFLLVKFSLRNTGKEVVESTIEYHGSSYRKIPYGTFTVIYDDEYTFDCEKAGFTTRLSVLGDAIKTVGCCEVPGSVYENVDKPLKIKVSLPNSMGEIEEFTVSVR